MNDRLSYRILSTGCPFRFLKTIGCPLRLHAYPILANVSTIGMFFVLAISVIYQLLDFHGGDRRAYGVVVHRPPSYPERQFVDVGCFGQFASHLLCAISTYKSGTSGVKNLSG
ncbi:hypothetical protein U1Q18_048193 [Sarracenia purpurea var. burkii]